MRLNRTWTTESGEKKEETEFHRVVAWNKLAELCSQLLTKGRKIYVEGRLRTNAWTAQDGSQRSTTEVVIEDMIILDSRRPVTGAEGEVPPDMIATEAAAPATPKATPATKKEAAEPKVETSGTSANEDVNPDDIPF